MQITFDTESFVSRNGARSLTNILCYLARHGCLTPAAYPSIEKITCRTPSEALRHVRFFAGKVGISPANEAVFLKNPTIALRYLKMVGRPEFADPKVQKRFRRKFRSNARLACDWAMAFGVRLGEDEEEVFRKDFTAACQYAKQVIRGKFPEKVHGMLLLASYGDVDHFQKRSLAEYIRFAEGK